MRAEPDCQCFQNHQTGLNFLSVCILGNLDRGATLTLCHLKRCKLFASTLSKNPTERFKLRHRNKTRMAVFTGKPHNSWPLNHYFALFRASVLGDGRQRQTHFYFGFGTASANLTNKLRLQQAISEQSVIIVTRLLYCSRRIKWKEKEK
jgi:hypothetical protein